MPLKFRRLTSSIYVKILAGFTAILLLSLFLGYGTLGEIKDVSTESAKMTPRIENIQTLAEMRSTLGLLEGRLTSTERISRDELETLVRRLDLDLSDILRRSSAPLDASGLKEFEDVIKATSRDVRSLLRSEVATITPETLGAILSGIDASKTSIDAFGRLVEDDTTMALTLQQTLLDQAMSRLLSTQIIVLLLGMILAMFLARMITSPIEILRESVLSVSRGDYGAKVAVRSRDELGELADAFNDMSTALKTYTTSLEGTVAERTRELNEKIATLGALTSDLDESAKMLIRRDVALTRATERLEELDSVKSEFISVAAHQLRTPLSAIKWTLSLLQDGDAGPVTPEQKDLFEKAAQSNERMIRLIEDMLTVTRIESGKATFVSVPVSLGEILIGITGEIATTAKDKGLTLTLAPLPQHRTILGDAEKLRSVFQNLLENAMRYTPKGGTITVTLFQKEHMVEIQVKDSGIGIPEKQRMNIFSKFFRADNAVKTVTDGTGLGLYVAKTIVERHHGSLRFESEEGKGTTFFITLPNEDAPFMSQ